jgi:hypothetical protein
MNSNLKTPNSLLLVHTHSCLAGQLEIQDTDLHDHPGPLSSSEARAGNGGGPGVNNQPLV